MRIDGTGSAPAREGEGDGSVLLLDRRLPPMIPNPLRKPARDNSTVSDASAFHSLNIPDNNWNDSLPANLNSGGTSEDRS
jgi:hypothetical protein